MYYGLHGLSMHRNNETKKMLLVCKSMHGVITDNHCKVPGEFNLTDTTR